MDDQPVLEIAPALQATSKPPKLLDRLRQAVRLRHYSRRTEQCGWLKDKYGVSWQVVPKVLPDLVKDPNSEKSQRAMTAMLRMKKLDIEQLRRAYEG